MVIRSNKMHSSSVNCFVLKNNSTFHKDIYEYPSIRFLVPTIINFEQPAF